MIKQIITFLIIALAVFVAVRFIFSGQPFTIEGFATYIVTGTQTTIQQVSVFIQDKWQMVAATLGGITTLVVTAYRGLKSRFDQMKQTANNAQDQVNELQNQAGQQYSDMKAEIDRQAGEIKSLKEQVTDNATLQSSINDKEAMLNVKQQELNNADAVIQSLQLQVEKLSAQVEALKPKQIA